MTEEDDIKIKRLCESLQKIHGKVVLRRENSGLHAYIPSPTCLERDGIVELDKLHGSLNLERFFGIGKWLTRRGTYNSDASFTCHKYPDKKYRVSDLLKMRSVEARGITVVAGDIKTPPPNENFLVTDKHGRQVPAPAGRTIALSELGEAHPSVQFLRKRGYMDLSRLEFMFGASFCLEETKEINGNRRFYRPLPAGFFDTPQGRIIFNAEVNGSTVAWQGRLIDRQVGNTYEVYHPYLERFYPVKVNGELTREIVEEQAAYAAKHPGKKLDWSPAKYLTSKAATRSQLVMGYDAAVAFSTAHGTSTVIVCEGPLDAGRFGPPAVAILGKYMNSGQAKLLAVHFKNAVYVADKDAAGKTAADSAKYALATFGVNVTTITIDALGGLPDQKDPGDLPQELADLAVRDLVK